MFIDVLHISSISVKALCVVCHIQYEIRFNSSDCVSQRMIRDILAITLPVVADTHLNQIGGTSQLSHFNVEHIQSLFLIYSISGHKSASTWLSFLYTFASLVHSLSVSFISVKFVQ